MDLQKIQQQIDGLNRIVQRLNTSRISNYPLYDVMYDFTGTNFNTKAKCQSAGFSFSDSDTPFPTTLVTTVDPAAWSHTAGRGWTAVTPGNDLGQALLFPIPRGANFEIEVGLDYDPVGVSDMGWWYLGYITTSGHIGAHANIGDFYAGFNYLVAELATNDGDDTETIRYSGATLAAAAGNYVYGFRVLNGCPGVYDDQDNAWHSYTGRPSVGISYTAAWGFLQEHKFSTFPFWRHHLRYLRVRTL